MSHSIRFSKHLNDKDMELSYPNNSIMELEEKLDMSVGQILADSLTATQAGKLPKFKVMIAIVWAGLIEKNEITFDEVVKRFTLTISEDLLVPSLEALTEALDFGGVDTSEKKNSTPEKALELEGS